MNSRHAHKTRFWYLSCRIQVHFFQGGEGSLISRLQNSRFFSKSLVARHEAPKAWILACEARENSVSPQFHSPFSHSLQIFRSKTARICLTDQRNLANFRWWLFSEGSTVANTLRDEHSQCSPLG